MVYISQSHHHTAGFILLCHSEPVYPLSLRSVSQLPWPSHTPHSDPRFLSRKPGELGLQPEPSCSHSAWISLSCLWPPDSGKGGYFSTIFPTAPTSVLFLLEGHRNVLGRWQPSPLVFEVSSIVLAIFYSRAESKTPVVVYLILGKIYVVIASFSQCR